MPKFQGVVPPVVTPYNADFSVDYPSYTRVLEHLIGGGCHGLFVLGSTSEVTFFDEATRRKILEHTVKVVNGRVPVITGASRRRTKSTSGSSGTAPESYRDRGHRAKPGERDARRREG